MKNRKKFILLIITFFIIFIILVNRWCFKVVNIRGKIFIAEIALTQFKQAKGLGGRSNICESCAMLFDFKEKGNYTFWMKDMLFDLDIIWIDNNKIVHIENNVHHDSQESIIPHIEADKVLEINTGLVEKYQFKVGDKVKFY